MAEGSTERLLSAVWGTRQGYVFLPFKDLNGTWHEKGRAFPYDGSKLPSIEDLRANLYFCPQVFSKPIRQKDYALSTNVLWADLDFAHPDECRIKPSIAWESSPGRYQALWFLSTEVPAEDAAALSKRIAYTDGADKGGWDVTQVLRIPGTRNYKYEAAPEVKLMWAKRWAYSVSEVLASYPPVNGDLTSGTPTTTDGWITVPEATVQSAIQALPIGLRNRITKDAAGADRSLELQKLARDLIRKGLEPEVVAHIIQRSTFNKFAGRRDEQTQLLKQIQSAVAAVAQRPTLQPKPQEPIEQMQVTQWGAFMSIPTRLRWLVDEAWVDGSVGFISGRSKSYKTWIALDLALSIVSGTPFLGRFPTRRTGPVLLVQEEDPTSVLQERLRLIGKSKEMLPEISIRDERVHIEYPDFPLHIINLQGFNLGVEDKVAQVRSLIAALNPVLVILDPLVVLLPQGVDEFKGTEMAQVLQVIKMWREQFGCSIAVVHHWNKTKLDPDQRFAEHMYGSFAFHAWLESALHVMPMIPEDGSQITQVLVEREFKAAPSGRGMKLTFAIDSTKEYEYRVDFEDTENPRITPMDDQFLALLQGAGTEGRTTPEIMAETGHPRPKVSEHLNKLVRAKLVIGKKGGGRGVSSRYWLPEFAPAGSPGN